MSKHKITIKSKLKIHSKSIKVIILTLVVLSVFIDIFFLKISSDIITFGLLSIYIILSNYYHFKSKFTFIYCIVLLFTMYIGFIISGPSPVTEKNAVWLFLFLLTGIVQKWKE